MPPIRDMITLMNDDPAQSTLSGGNIPISTNNPIIPSNTQASSSVGKEVEGGIALGEPMSLKDTGSQELLLPPEVAVSGVHAYPTTVPLPQNVQSLGVTQTGSSTPTTAAAATPLPLTDDQITKGLKQSITSSWRWLAEWCVRKLKQLHKKITMTKSQ